MSSLSIVILVKRTLSTSPLTTLRAVFPAFVLEFHSSAQAHLGKELRFEISIIELLTMNYLSAYYR